ENGPSTFGPFHARLAPSNARGDGVASWLLGSWRSPLLWSALYLVLRQLFQLVVLVARSQRSKELEILLLRHELAILRREKPRPRLDNGDRLLLAALARVLPRDLRPLFVVTPTTLCAGTGGSSRGAGRTPWGAQTRAVARVRADKALLHDRSRGRFCAVST